MRRAALTLPLVLVALLAAIPAGAQAYTVGFSEQQPGMFSDPLFQGLNVHQARLIVSWNAAQTDEAAEVDAWLSAAQGAGVEPLVSFNHARDCFARTCTLPSVAAYTQAFLAFHRRWPEVRTISPWNEANHFSQPTWKNPRRAASYYNAVRANCAGCTIVAADVLDQGGVGRWLRKFQRYARGKPRIWGLHNYSDTNRFRSTGTRAVLAAVRGQVWLTETGGVVHFGTSFPENAKRAARATKFMFRLARSSPRIARLYIYQWTGATQATRFDAGLMDPSGQPRPAFYVVQQTLAKLTGGR
jgi:hypothetical protein